MAQERGSSKAPIARVDFDRRTFMSRGALVAAVAAPAMTVAGAPPAMAQAAASPGLGDRQEAQLTINGKEYRLAVDPRTTLLDALRDHAGLTGTKKGCDHGQCGACTVHVDGRRTLSCMSFALMAHGHEVTTIEGLSATGAELHPMQQAFVDHDAFQCGYCTPGQIMSAIACVNEGHAGNESEVAEYMSGNLCRCAAYPNIVSAILQAKTEMERS